MAQTFPLLLFCALAAATAVSAGNVPAPTEPYDLRGAATYSNICVHNETGDALGLRVFVRARDQHPRVVVQYAEGDLADIVAAKSRVVGGRLTFTVPASDNGAAASGVIRGRYAVLRPKPTEGRGRLVLRDDTHGFPDCW